MSLNKGEPDRKREKATLWYDYYFFDPDGSNFQTIQSCRWHYILAHNNLVRKIGADMDRDDSEPKDINSALVAFVMNDNEFPNNLKRRVDREVDGRVKGNKDAKGSNQWGINLYNELQWLDDQDRQNDFVILKDYVKPMGARGLRPSDSERDGPDSDSGEHGPSSSKKVKSKAQRTGCASMQENSTNDTPSPSQRELSNPTTTLSQPVSSISSQIAQVAIKKGELSSARGSDKQHEQQPQTDVDPKTVSISPYGDKQHAHKETAHKMSTADVQGGQKRHVPKRTRSYLAGSQNSYGAVAKKHKTASARRMYLGKEDGIPEPKYSIQGLARPYNLAAMAKHEVVPDDDQDEKASKRLDPGETIKAIIEDALNKGLSTLQVQLRESLDSMEGRVIKQMTQVMDNNKTDEMAPGHQVFKPGSKLPNGVIVWDVRLLTTTWDPLDFHDFLSIVGKEDWDEDNRTWKLQEEYLTELALAHPCGPESLAKLARTHELTKFEVDPQNDQPVCLAVKVYIRSLLETFDIDQLAVFSSSVNAG